MRAWMASAASCISRSGSRMARDPVRHVAEEPDLLRAVLARASGGAAPRWRAKLARLLGGLRRLVLLLGQAPDASSSWAAATPPAGGRTAREGRAANRPARPGPGRLEHQGRGSGNARNRARAQQARAAGPAAASARPERSSSPPSRRARSRPRSGSRRDGRDAAHPASSRAHDEPSRCGLSAPPLLSAREGGHPSSLRGTGGRCRRSGLRADAREPAWSGARRTPAASGSARPRPAGRRRPGVTADQAADARQHVAEVQAVGAPAAPRHRELEHHERPPGKSTRRISRSAAAGRRRCGCRRRRCGVESGRRAPAAVRRPRPRAAARAAGRAAQLPARARASRARSTPTARRGSARGTRSAGRAVPVQTSSTARRPPEASMRAAPPAHVDARREQRG